MRRSSAEPSAGDCADAGVGTDVLSVASSSFTMNAQSEELLRFPKGLEESTREFSKFPAFLRLTTSIHAAISVRCGKIPWRTERGMCSTEQAAIIVRPGLDPGIDRAIQ